MLYHAFAFIHFLSPINFYLEIFPSKDEYSYTTYKYKKLLNQKKTYKYINLAN